MFGKRVRFKTVAVVLIAIAAASYFFGPEVWWHYQLFRHFKVADVTHIEYRPHIDWPLQHVDDPKTIAAFKGWLRGTIPTNSLQSAPPRPMCDLVIHFRDGHTEFMKLSPVVPR